VLGIVTAVLLLALGATVGGGVAGAVWITGWLLWRRYPDAVRAWIMRGQRR
jgi:hypothetical protein